MMNDAVVMFVVILLGHVLYVVDDVFVIFGVVAVVDLAIHILDVKLVDRDLIV